VLVADAVMVARARVLAERRMASRVRGCLAVRPSADARGFEVVVESSTGIKMLGPFSNAQDVEDAVHNALSLMLPRPDTMPTSPAR